MGTHKLTADQKRAIETARGIGAIADEETRRVAAALLRERAAGMQEAIEMCPGTFEEFRPVHEVAERYKDAAVALENPA